MMTDNVHVEDVRKKRLYGILKAVAVIVAVLVVFAISFVLFTALSGTFDPSDGLKADAWSLGGISGVSTSGGANWFSTPGSWNSGTSIFSAPTPMTAASGFSGTSFNTGGGSSKTWYFMQLYEIRLNSAQIAAANAGYLGTISLSFRLDGNVGSDFMYNWGRTQFTMFIVAGSAGGGSLNSFTAISGTSKSEGFDKEQSNLSRSLSFAVPRGTTVVRFGVTISFSFYNRSWYWPGNPTVTFNGVSLTKYECTQNGMPKLTINSGANGSISSNKYNGYQLSLDTVVDAVSATANPGYYFSGWDISGGVIHSSDSWDVNNANNSNIIATRAPLLNIGNATRIVGASNATVTVTATFKEIVFLDKKKVRKML